MYDRKTWAAGRCAHVRRIPSTQTQINYKNVMKEYNLGPNGAILTSLNLFATRFDQVCVARSGDDAAGYILEPFFMTHCN